MKQTNFDVMKAIPAAFELLWKSNLKQRAESRDRSRFSAQTYYLCAQDIERQVRAFAEDTAEGKAWTEERRYGVYSGRIKMRGDLQSLVRSWLFAQVRAGVLVTHNFNRGHISGARFRPVGEPLSEAEKKTMARKEARKTRVPPIHSGNHGRPLCTAHSRKAFHRGPTRGVYCSTDKEKVTCKRCLNKLAKASS